MAGRVVKILHVVDSGGMYGAEAVIVSLIEGQRGRGHEAALASIGTHSDREKAVEAEAARRHVPVHRVRMRPGPNPVGAQRLLALARGEGADVVHSHGYKPNILLGFWPRRLRPPVLVSTIHGYTHGSWRMSSYEWLDRRALRRFDCAVLVHEGMRRIPGLDTLDGRLRVIENGTPTGAVDAVVDPAVAGFCQSGGAVVGAVGRLSQEKGLDVLVAAFGALPASTRLVLLGEGPERPRLEQAIRRHGLQDRVLVPGFRSGLAHLPLFDVFVLPSLTEGLPISLLEAMTAGRPILATRVGGVPEVLEQGACGLLVEPGNTEQLAAGLARLLADRALAARLGTAARARSLAYSNERMTERYLALYAELLASARTEAAR